MKCLEVVCSHCGARDLDETGEHFCMGAIFDWLEQKDGQQRKRSYYELKEVIEEFGLNS